MGIAIRMFVTLLSTAALATAQNGNDSNFNNGGDVILFYSTPLSIGGPAAGPPNPLGDLYWRAHTGANFMNDTFGAGTQTMEIDGYYESIYDTDWTTTPSFYVRGHHPMIGPTPDLTTGTIVVLGPSGLGDPCNVESSLCDSMGCPVSGVNGYTVSIQFGPMPGDGIVLPSDGTAASDTATVWYVTGGMSNFGGPCNLGDYVLQDVHSTDETQADPGSGFNPSGGFQITSSGLLNEGINSMAEGHEQWRGNIVNVVARSAGEPAVEVGDLLGGAMNGRRLPVSGGGATIGVELRDLAGAGGLNIGVVAASLTKLPGPGIPALGGWLKILPVGLYSSTSALWQGAVVPVLTGDTSDLTDDTMEGVFGGVQVPIPVTAVGATVFVQGAIVTPTLTIDSTNVVSTVLVL